MAFLSHPKLEPTVGAVGPGYVIELTLAQAEVGIAKGVLYIGNDGLTHVSTDYGYNDVQELTYEA